MRPSHLRLLVVAFLPCLMACSTTLGSFQDEAGPDIDPFLDDEPVAEFTDDRSYLRRRWDDWSRALSVRVGVGPGLGARFAATRYVQAGLMKIGPSDQFGEILKWRSIYVGNSAEQWGAWDQRSVEYGLSRWYWYDDDVIGYPDPATPWFDHYDNRSSTAIEAGLHVAVVGASVSFDPLEFVHFLGRWFTDT